VWVQAQVRVVAPEGPSLEVVRQPLSRR
jgi:hypothetical protein